MAQWQPTRSVSTMRVQTVSQIKPLHWRRTAQWLSLTLAPHAGAVDDTYQASPRHALRVSYAQVEVEPLGTSPLAAYEY